MRAKIKKIKNLKKRDKDFVNSNSCYLLTVTVEIHFDVEVMIFNNLNWISWWWWSNESFSDGNLILASPVEDRLKFIVSFKIGGKKLLYRPSKLPLQKK